MKPYTRIEAEKEIKRIIEQEQHPVKIARELIGLLFGRQEKECDKCGGCCTLHYMKPGAAIFAGDSYIHEEYTEHTDARMEGDEVIPPYDTVTKEYLSCVCNVCGYRTYRDVLEVGVMSLFPEVDEEVSEIEVAFHKYVKGIEESTELYTPSNGTEAGMFVDMYCEQCPMDDGEDKICDVMAEYIGNGRHESVRIDAGGAFLCLSSPMFKKRARERFDQENKYGKR